MTSRRLNPVEARDMWLAQEPPRSYQPVADAFTVSRQRVRFIAKRDNWERLAADLDRKAREQAERRILRTREQRTEVYAKIVDKAYDTALSGLLEETVEVNLRDLPALGKHLELLLGEATDRMSFAEAQEALAAVLQLGIDAVENGWSAERLVVEFRRRIGSGDGPAQVAA